jgi:hypothetical protein
MQLRACAVLAGLLASVPAMAGEMSANEARTFVVGKLFSYHCFEGTRGQGFVYADGSVAGSVQFQGHGRMHYAALPPNTLRVRGQTVCASLRGLPVQPCFNLVRTGNDSFRGSISGLGFAYCNFTRRHERAEVAQQPAEVAHKDTEVSHEAHEARAGAPLALRPTLAAE